MWMWGSGDCCTYSPLAALGRKASLKINVCCLEFCHLFLNKRIFEILLKQVLFVKSFWKNSVHFAKFPELSLCTGAQTCTLNVSWTLVKLGSRNLQSASASWLDPARWEVNPLWLGQGLISLLHVTLAGNLTVTWNFLSWCLLRSTQVNRDLRMWPL